MLLSYFNLASNSGELKFLRALADTQAKGVTQADLDAAELWARDRINLWIVKVAGEKRGAEIVAEFLAMTTNSTVDPAIRHLAEKVAATRILRLLETRNYIDQGPTGADQMRRRDWTEVQAEATALATEIEKRKKTFKADGTLRRWGLGRGQQGPVVNGPMTSGSRFEDSRLFTNYAGNLFVTPENAPE